MMDVVLVSFFKVVYKLKIIKGEDRFFGAVLIYVDRRTHASFMNPRPARRSFAFAIALRPVSFSKRNPLGAKGGDSLTLRQNFANK